MKRNLALRVLVCLTLVAIPFMLPTPVSACSCMMPGSPAEAFRDYEAVFSGKVIDIAGTYSPVMALLDQLLIRLNLRPSYFYTNAFWGNAVTFSVHQSWKGVSATEITIYTGSGGGDCGYSFAPGSDYLVYAYHTDSTSGSGLATSICSRTAELSHATEDLTYLNPQPTLALTPVSNNTWLYATGCAVVFLGFSGGGIVLWMRYTKRRTAA